MIEQEEILLNTNRTGVTFYTFSTKSFNKLPVNEEQYGGPFPSYVLYNNNNQPLGLYNFDGVNLVGMNNKYNYVPLSQLTTNYVTGYSIVNIIDSDLSNDEIQNKINLGLDRLADPIKNPQGIGAKNHMFYKKHVLNDMFVNIKMERSFNSLDTLKIYNNLLNSIPTQEAKTGVVFGSLTASQQITDENGLTVKIPLRNVPVGIFNKSETFPSVTSLDENGNRITLNLTQTSTLSSYFNTESFENDSQYLQNGSGFTSVPDQYKYVTFTNENGEFILYDVPVGEQVLMFEVDLFRQGLTKDEIQHNFFPFPVNENPNIDNIPSFFFRQVPIDVFPAWGTSQTGYTEVDVNVNLDLRKWTTYIFAPAAYGNEKLEVSTARNAANTFKIEILDMTSEGFVQKPVEVVQIVNDLDRQEGDQFLWYDEFKSKRKRVEYSQFGCHVLKLPGNIYDPNAYRTNKDGIPTIGNSYNKGVWLSSYQFSCYINSDRTVRNTGNYSWGDPKKFLNHFKLNYTTANAGPGNMTGPQVGVYPYERRWSITYPEPYNITKKPVQLRYNYRHERRYGNQFPYLDPPANTQPNPIYNAGPMVLEEPAYADGDLVGNMTDGAAGGDAGGFGTQTANGVWFPNRIAAVATKNYVYKYERGVAWNEVYANGYEPYWTGPGGTGVPLAYANYPLLAGMSSVNNGERFQRLECGYGYFMKYQGWKTIWRWPWVWDIPWDGFGTGAVSVLPTPVNVWNLDDNNYAFAFDSIENKGGIDIYRIVNSGTENIIFPKQFVIPTYSLLSLPGSANRCYSFELTNSGNIPAKMTNQWRGFIYIPSQNITVNPGGVFTLQPGQSYYIGPDAGPPGFFGNNTDVHETCRDSQHLLPGNASFDSNTNKYNQSYYTLRVLVSGNFANGNNFGNDGRAYGIDIYSAQARSSNFQELKIWSQSDANANKTYAITNVGNTNNTDDLIDVLFEVVN